ncbi:MAG: SH3 domain-containing protein [Bauldia sp.]
MDCGAYMNSGRAPIWPGFLHAALTVAGLVILALFTAEGAKADPVVAGEEHCVINVRSDDVLNMRTAPSATAPIIAQKAYGQCGIIVTGACLGNWCPVEDGHNPGWVHRTYIAMVSPSLYCVTGVAPWDVLNLRAFPSARSRILTTLPPNQCDIAFLPYATNGWQKIRVGGWEGWAARRFLSGQ